MLDWKLGGGGNCNVLYQSVQEVGKKKVLALYSTLSRSMAQSPFTISDQIHFCYLSYIWELKHASNKGRKEQGKASVPMALCISFS